MTRRVLLVFGAMIALLVVGIFLALHHVQSPFASVVLRGDTIVATMRSDVRFLVFRANSRELESISGSESLELRTGDSLRLQSAHTSYEIACRMSPPPAGLDVKGEWHLHDFPKSFVKKWFVKAQ